jgi:hypothetical protein
MPSKARGFWLSHGYLPKACPLRLVVKNSGVENVGSSPSSRTAGFDFLPMEKTARVGVGLTQDLVG